jgi:flagellin
MAMVINTNMGAINANRILDATSREQSVAMERLTSGKAINKAADNAAGLAVSTEMTKQVMGLDQAVRNANDGVSLIQTMDGAMDEITNMLQRMRELGIQSMNGTYTAANRSQMDAEFTQLQSEIHRVATTTKFNGTSLLDTAAASIAFQVGWETNAADKITVAMSAFSETALQTVTAQEILSTAAAASAVGTIDTDLANINLSRARWGAIQNRLESTISNLQNVSENTSAARSRIQDADFARESANLARTQVLQQAGMSMLSQSNQQSQNVLSLLR